MDKTKKEQAEKLQIKLDKLLQSREKKQAAFDKAKQELNAVTKSIDGVKLKLFEILQSGSDDTAFSSWAKQKIDESGNHENGVAENAKSAKNENGHSAKTETPEKPVSQNHQPQPDQNHQQRTGQNHNQPRQQTPQQ